MKPERISAGVYMLDVPFPKGLFPEDTLASTKCYLVQQDAGWLLIDCGLDHWTCFKALTEQLSCIGLGLRDIRWLVITHFHPDHCGQAGRIKKGGNSCVIMHRVDWEVMQVLTQTKEEWPIEKFDQWMTSMGIPPSETGQYLDLVRFGTGLFPPSTPPDVLLEGDEEPLGDGGNLVALLTPGHTPGHISVYDRRTHFLFSGDHVLEGISSNVMQAFGETGMLRKYLNSLELVRKLDVSLVLPAHEKPFANLGKRVDELLSHHEQRLSNVLTAVGKSPETLRQIAAQVEWTAGSWGSFDVMNQMLALQETLAHLHVLQERGLVVISERNGTTLCRRPGGV